MIFITDEKMQELSQAISQKARGAAQDGIDAGKETEVDANLVADIIINLIDEGVEVDDPHIMLVAVAAATFLRLRGLFGPPRHEPSEEDAIAKLAKLMRGYV